MIRCEDRIEQRKGGLIQGPLIPETPPPSTYEESASINCNTTKEALTRRRHRDTSPPEGSDCRDGDSEAELIYHTRPGRLILVHTEVPDALGGRSIGGHLVQAALDRAAATGETVVPLCPFARNWLQKHPEAMRGVTVEMRDDG